jgi:hypothetical protein
MPNYLIADALRRALDSSNPDTTRAIVTATLHSIQRDLDARDAWDEQQEALAALRDLNSYPDAVESAPF